MRREERSAAMELEEIDVSSPPSSKPPQKRKGKGRTPTEVRVPVSFVGFPKPAKKLPKSRSRYDYEEMWDGRTVDELTEAEAKERLKEAISYIASLQKKASDMTELAKGWWFGHEHGARLPPRMTTKKKDKVTK